MRQLRLALTAVLMVLGLAAFAAACGGDDDSGGGGSGGTPATSDDVNLTQGQDMTIADGHARRGRLVLGGREEGRRGRRRSRWA